MPDTSPVPNPPAEGSPPAALHVYRLVVWTVVMIAVIVLVRQPLAALPEPPRAAQAQITTDFSADFTAAEAIKDLHDYSADSAPKQQVVNGWYTNDMLEIIGQQNDSMLQSQARQAEAQQAASSSAYDLAVWQAQDRRPESLLVVFGLGAAAHIAGSSLILLLAGRARRQPGQGLLPSDGDPEGPEGPATLLEPQEPQPDTTRPFDPRPNG